jgi:hypothetical protein
MARVERRSVVEVAVLEVAPGAGSEVTQLYGAVGGWCYGHVAIDGDEVRPGDPSTNSSRRPQDGRLVKRMFRANRLLGVRSVALGPVSALDEVVDCSGGSRPQPAD